MGKGVSYHDGELTYHGEGLTYHHGWVFLSGPFEKHRCKNFFLVFICVTDKLTSKPFSNVRNPDIFRLAHN